jgi:hypothetical protein
MALSCIGKFHFGFFHSQKKGTIFFSQFILHCPCSEKQLNSTISKEKRRRRKKSKSDIKLLFLCATSMTRNAYAHYKNVSFLLFRVE